MYTQCPECETTFKLGADELRRANGKVRCGDCDTVFNALEYLAEEVSENTGEMTAAEVTGDGWTSSSTNPSGDIEPDLDEYEANDFIDDADSDAGNAFAQEEDDNDDGAILYIDEGSTETGTEDDDSEFDESVWDNISGVGTQGDEEDSGDDADDPQTAETETTDGENLEFNVPEDKWTNFFGPLPKGQVASVWQPPVLNDDAGSIDEAREANTWGESDEAESDIWGQSDEAESATGDADAEVMAGSAGDNDSDELAPEWQATEERDKPARLIPVAATVAAVLLVTQLIHYNRDSIAASPAYGHQLRSIYAAVGSELYPHWDIADYEIRGSEAIAGESGADILDIRAQIANTGEHAVGLPRLRVVLRDRWSNPVAAQDFGPEDYAAGNLPDDGLLQPGAVIGTHVSIRDPGAGAQGFELELCLPRRHTGLECTDQPFK